MLIQPDSPLFAPPSNLNRKEVFLLAGVRYSLEAVDLSYRRLFNGLVAFTHKLVPQSGTERVSISHPPAFVDAWACVDALNRLTILLRLLDAMGAPEDRPKETTPLMDAWDAFMEVTTDLKWLRNQIQHLEARQDRWVNLGVPVFGVLSWLVPGDRQGETLYGVNLVSGAFYGGKHLLISPMERMRFRNGIGEVQLSAFEKVISLSGAHSATVDLANRLEAHLEAQKAADMKTLPTDTAITLTFKKHEP